jgi:uncharacterized membrane protein
MNAWVEYTAAWVAFLLSHAIPVRPPVRPWLVARLGSAGFGIIYSVISVAILIWLIATAGRAPYVEVWPRAEWQNHVTVVAMALALPDFCARGFPAQPIFVRRLAQRAV